ncbi:hypothetical protein HJC23_011584 [Cyclotella cryptica]|uniref:Uncharacterized protein n=1 Tax=Cyclotella cryptica TaxID=29204 RepID=A0ABD3QVB0_9STRA|eukprot:CCRYP_002692-RC/>CCRYP_002692-RC protein AED:0.05 eAED:0.05 QI:211/1/1/1/0.5/0.2/5/309/1096
MKSPRQIKPLTLSVLSTLLSSHAQSSTLETVAATVTSTVEQSNTCDSSSTILQGECDPTLCDEYCNLYGSTYLSKKCCAHAGVNANLLAFEESATWIPRIDEFHKCTGANIKLQYVPGGEDFMGEALIEDVGLNNNEDSGQGIYDAYIVQAPWLPPVYLGLKSLSEYIKENEKYINFMDINQASRSAVSFDGEVRALPLDTDYVAMGWRQDVFTKHAEEYRKKYGQELKVPTTIEELVDVSEKLNGFDHNGDGEPDWGFCLTPQTNYFNAFVAPIFQTHLRECLADSTGEGTICNKGANTGQNIFFDVETFEPLVFNEGFKYAVKLYWRFVRSSNCQEESLNGGACDRKTAFPTGRCAGVLSMPGTLTTLLSEGGKYAPPPEYRMDDVLSEGEYWGRRAVFPGSTKVLDWKAEGLPLVDCTEEKCPLARDGVNYAPFFAEGGESYALNGRQSKPAATHAMWDLFTWFAELPVGDIPLSGVYRKSQLEPEAIEELGDLWNNTIVANDLGDVLGELFKSETEGGNPVQDLFIIGFPQYNDVLDLELHTKMIIKDMSEGGSFPLDDEDKFNERFDEFTKALKGGYEEVNSLQEGGALQQLYLWRGALDLHPPKSKQNICEDLLATDQAAFTKLNCLSVVSLKDLCQSQESDVEEYEPGTCSSDNHTVIIVVIVLCSILCGFLLLGLVYYVYKRYVTYQRIKKAHEQQMEATLNESIRSLHQLDYPLHLVRGDEFAGGQKLMRHEVLRNTHRLTVLDSLSDVDAFIAAGKHIVFFSHQWTSFTFPDPSNNQYNVMRSALDELARQNNWDKSLKDVFAWIDYSCIPQANPSTQNLAIRSLAAYASSATYFIIVAPDTPHADLDDVCDLSSYQRRMWCRAEQVCHSMRNGTQGMYVALSKYKLDRVTSDHFIESLHVFNGELTCCRLEHKGMGACDRQSLVIPLLGLYGELFRAAHDGIKGGNADALSSVAAFLEEIEKHQELIFPRTFKRVSWRKNKRVTEEVMLFGDLIDRMRSRIQHGIGFAIDEENTGTASTQSSDFIRHGGGVEYIRHGVVHEGSASQSAASNDGDMQVGGVTPSLGTFVHQGSSNGKTGRGNLDEA